MCSLCHGGPNHGWCAICEEQAKEAGRVTEPLGERINSAWASFLADGEPEGRES